MKLFPHNTTKKRQRANSVNNNNENDTTALLVDPTTTTTTTTNHVKLQEFRRNLPVFSYRAQLLRSVGTSTELVVQQQHSSKVLLVTAETGSGKSTQIPSYFLQSHHRMAVTQPRRVAAMTLAKRVALEQNVTLGGKQVGYRVRFDDCTEGENTQLVYVTDGMLLREAMVDPILSRYSLIFLDEAHERSLQTDIVMGVVQRARLARLSTDSENRQQKKPLAVVIMSATLQLETFRNFFGHDSTMTITIPGRQFPVELLYTDQVQEDYMEAALATVLQIHDQEPIPGDVLVFLPGQEEIEDLASLLRQQLQEDQVETEWTGDKVIPLQKQQKNLNHSTTTSNITIVGSVMICVLYAALPPEAQLAAFIETKPPGCTRKVILATNIAETSVTLPNIRYVVDTGKHKCRAVLNPATGMESLTVEDVSQEQATQRAGRAGRVQAGLCFRLYTEDAFHSLAPSTTPEILRVNLAQVVLQLKGMGIADPTEFEFVTPPEKTALVRATKLLFALQALNDQMELTEYGKQLAKLPLDPTFGHLLLQSTKYSCVKEMLTAVSVLSVDNLFYTPGGGNHSGIGGGLAAKATAAHRRFASHEGDLPTYLNVYQAWQTEALYGVGKKTAKKLRRLQQTNTNNNNNNNNNNNGNKQKLLLSHGEWCQRNFISGRALARAHAIRLQLSTLCDRTASRNGLGMDIHLSCGNDRVLFLKCAAAGLFLQAAARIKVADNTVNSSSSKGRSGSLVQWQRGRYRTKVGKETVSIHPTSTLFNRNPAPHCIVYTELVTTKKTYIRGVTQIREEWLAEVAPQFYS